MMKKGPKKLVAMFLTLAMMFTMWSPSYAIVAGTKPTSATENNTVVAGNTPTVTDEKPMEEADASADKTQTGSPAAVKDSEDSNADIMPIAATKQYAQTSEYEITYTSNNMEKFKTLFDSDSFTWTGSSAPSASVSTSKLDYSEFNDVYKKKENQYTYSLPLYRVNGAAKYYDAYENATKPATFSIRIKNLKDIESFTLTYGDDAYHFRPADILNAVSSESGSNTYFYHTFKVTGYEASAGKYTNPSIGAQCNVTTSKLGLDYNIYLNNTFCFTFDRTLFEHNVTLSVNFDNGEDLPDVPLSVTDDEHVTEKGMLHGDSSGEYLAYAIPQDGYYVAYWEATYDGNAYFPIDGTEKQKYLAIKNTADFTEAKGYRAVIKEYSWNGIAISVSFENAESIPSYTLKQDWAGRYDISETCSGDRKFSLNHVLANKPNDVKNGFFKLTNIKGSGLIGYIFKIGKETYLCTGNRTFDGFSVSATCKKASNYFNLTITDFEVLSALTADSGIEIIGVYKKELTHSVTVLSNDNKKGSVNSDILVCGGKYMLSATPTNKCAVSHWEVAEGTVDKDSLGFKKVEGSEGKETLEIPEEEVTGDVTYKAVFEDVDENTVNVTSDSMAVTMLTYATKARSQLMFNNYPTKYLGSAPKPPASPSGYYMPNRTGVAGSLSASAFGTGLESEAQIKNNNTDVTMSMQVEGGTGAILQFGFRFYKDLEDIKVKIYKGESTKDKDLICSYDQELLEWGKGQAIVSLPVIGMPYTDKVTVEFTAKDGIKTQKTLPLAKPMIENPLSEQRVAASRAIMDKYDELLKQLSEESVTYMYSSEALMLKEERNYALQDVISADSVAAVEKAKEEGLKRLADTANGIYYHGVDVCIRFNGSIRIVRVPEFSFVFEPMCAALEQAYPDGHWYYNVGNGGFGIVFDQCGYLVDNAKGYGVINVGAAAAGGYGASDFFTDYRLGALNSGLPLANGVSNQCVWNGMVTNTPNKFNSAGAPKVKIKLEVNKNYITWDLTRLLQHYTEDELLANETYMAAYNLRNADADTEQQEKALTALRLEYLDVLYAPSTDATKSVIKQIAELKEGDDTGEVRKEYDSLSQEEKDDVFNYKDLVSIEQAGLSGDALSASKLDELIRAIGKVEYTQKCRDKIAAAKKAYDNASREVRDLLTQYDALQAAENDFDALKNKKVNAFKNAVAALPEKVTYPDSREAVEAAGAAWDELLQAERDALSSTYEKVNKAQEAYDNAKAAYFAQYLDGAAEAVLEFLGQTVVDPQVGSVGGEWVVLAQARGGRDKEKYYNEYFETVARYVKEVGSAKLDRNKSTENSRVILALAAIGKDATNVGGYDLISPYADFDWIKNQGINGVIFALMSLDAGGYEIPVDNTVENQTTREKLIGYLLKKQTKDGGWSLTGDTADADITAMALQALAPYYNSNDKVKKAVDKALKKLSAMQNSDGSFGSQVSGSGDNVESTAQVVIALLTLGINPVEDSRFVKGKANALTSILEYQLKDGSFEHILGGGYDQMATEQAALALVAYKRFLAGETPLFAMTDKELNIGESGSDTPNKNDENDKNIGGNVTDKNDEDIKESGDKKVEKTDRPAAGNGIAPVTGRMTGRSITAKTGDEGKEKEETAGWKFTGDRYTPEQNVDTAVTVGGKGGSSINWLIIIIVLCVAAAVAVCVYVRRKRNAGQ